MEYEYRQQRQGDLAHPDGWVVALKPEKDAGGIKEEGIEQDDDYEGDAIAIQIFGMGPVMASWVEIANHVAKGGPARGDGC